MSAAETDAAARRAAVWVRLDSRAVLEVTGADRTRYLQGQITNDVEALDPSGPRAGRHALVLTREGRIVAEVHVVARPESFWLETDAVSRADAIERLSKYVVADDVAIADATAAFARFAIEGPRARAVVGAAAGAALALGTEEVAALRIREAAVVAAGWSLVGGAGVQLFAPRAAADEVRAALLEAGRAHGAVEAGEDALELLRIEAGVPRAGAELGRDTLPAELHLVERTVSFTKGCFTGQEVVTRMHTRGRVGHLLVGVALHGDPLPPVGAAVEIGGARVGALTSVARSPRAGAIALALVRRGSDEPGTEVSIEGRSARVVELPFVRDAVSA
jgi:folate-binding protein YgfZ